MPRPRATLPLIPPSSTIYHADNAAILPRLPDAFFQVIYADPPFNTGRKQTRRTLATTPDDQGDRTGFNGRRYRTKLLNESSYRDSFDDYLAFLEPRLREARRLLTQTGTLYLHLDYREAHYAKLLLDEVFGRDCFLNEIVWAYDYGARTKRRWPAKHDTILVYVKDPQRYFFDSEEVDREPYMAPGLVTAEKAARGKLPNDVWWHTIVSPTGRRRPVIRRKSRSASSAASCRRRRDRATGASTPSRAAARSARRPRSWDAATSSSIRIRKRSE